MPRRRRPSRGSRRPLPRWAMSFGPPVVSLLDGHPLSRRTSWESWSSICSRRWTGSCRGPAGRRGPCGGIRLWRLAGALFRRGVGEGHHRPHRGLGGAAARPQDL
jgi:hypothetical protein